MPFARGLSKINLLAKNVHQINRLQASTLHTQTSTWLCATSSASNLPPRRACSASAIAQPPTAGSERGYPPKIQQLVHDISQLSLIEVADLNELLKKTLKIADAPMMAMGAMAAGPAAAPKEEEVEEETVKMAYSVKLTGYDDTKKVALIKAIKATIEGMNLVQAKKFVESVPAEVKGDLIKAEAEELQKTLEAAGAKIELV